LAIARGSLAPRGPPGATEERAHSIELREKEWGIAARIRERALADAREHVGPLLSELSAVRAALRLQKTHIGELEAEVQQLSGVIERAISKNRTATAKHAPIPRATVRLKPNPKPNQPGRRSRSTAPGRKTLGTGIVLLIDFATRRVSRFNGGSLLLVAAADVLSLVNTFVHRSNGWQALVPPGSGLSAASLVLLLIAGARWWIFTGSPATGPRP
jgi:hypothetical protein